MQSNTNNTNEPITEEELAELETSCARSVNSERVPDRWLLTLKLASEVPRLIAEVRRLRWILKNSVTFTLTPNSNHEGWE